MVACVTYDSSAQRRRPDSIVHGFKPCWDPDARCARMEVVCLNGILNRGTARSRRECRWCLKTAGHAGLCLKKVFVGRWDVRDVNVLQGQFFLGGE